MHSKLLAGLASGSVGRMIRSNVLTAGQLESVEAAVEPGWIEVVKPTTEDQAALSAALGLHELAIEDALRKAHPPKLEEFGDHLFVIAHTPVEDEDRETRKLAMFIAEGWLVTIVREPMEILDEVRNRVAKNPTHASHSSLTSTLPAA